MQKEYQQKETKNRGGHLLKTAFILQQPVYQLNKSLKTTAFLCTETWCLGKKKSSKKQHELCYRASHNVLSLRLDAVRVILKSFKDPEGYATKKLSDNPHKMSARLNCGI